MELTGKAKEKFEKWYVTRDWYNPISINTEHTPNIDFYDLPKSMQWGVYQDWADSLGYDISIVSSYYDGWQYSFTTCSPSGQFLEHNQVYQTREQAQYSAVDKLDDLINEK